MRPKVVVVTLIAAFCVLGMVAVLKGLSAKHAGDNGGQTGSTANVDSASAGTNAKGMQVAGTSGNPAVSDEMRAAIIAKEIEQIQQMVGESNGANNPVIITALIDKLADPADEVRKAALAALVQLNDTNAVPGLQQAVGRMQDPRTKVAIMDTIDYLNLPDAIPSEPPPGYTNHVGPVPRNIKMNQKFLHYANEGGPSPAGGQQAVSPNMQAGQPK